MGDFHLSLETLTHNLILAAMLLAWLELRFRPIALKIVAKEDQQTSLLLAIAAKQGVAGLSDEEAARRAAAEVPDLVPLIQKLAGTLEKNP